MRCAPLPGIINRESSGLPGVRMQPQEQVGLRSIGNLGSILVGDELAFAILRHHHGESIVFQLAAQQQGNLPVNRDFAQAIR